MKKKGLTPGILVGVIAVVATLVILLITVMPQLIEVLYSSGEQSQCQLNLLLSAMAKKVTFGFGKEIPVECKTKRKTVTLNDINRLRFLAKESIEGYKQKDSDSYYMFDKGTEKGEAKWALAKIVADEMIKCHDRGWRGRLEMKETELNTLLGSGLNGNYMCILCSRIDFSPEIKSMKLENIELPFFVREQIVRQKTYFDYLTDNDDEVDKRLSSVAIDMSFAPATKPLAVVFVVDEGGSGRTYVAPYEEITTNLGLTKYKVDNINWQQWVAQQAGIDPNSFLGNLARYSMGGVLITAPTDIYKFAKQLSQADKEKYLAHCAVIIGD